jgi:hypothetical protein
LISDLEVEGAYVYLSYWGYVFVHTGYAFNLEAKESMPKKYETEHTR